MSQPLVRGRVARRLPLETTSLDNADRGSFVCQTASRGKSCLEHVMPQVRPESITAKPAAIQYRVDAVPTLRRTVPPSGLVDLDARLFGRGAQVRVFVPQRLHRVELRVNGLPGAVQCLRHSRDRHSLEPQHHHRPEQRLRKMLQPQEFVELLFHIALIFDWRPRRDLLQVKHSIDRATSSSALPAALIALPADQRVVGYALCHIPKIIAGRNRRVLPGPGLAQHLIEHFQRQVVLIDDGARLIAHPMPKRAAEPW